LSTKLALKVRYNSSMTLILTHEKADFDAVASQLGAKKLHPAAIALLPRHINRNVQHFLNLYWDSLPFIRPDEWRRRQVEEVILVDTQTLGNVRGLVAAPKVQVIDHHTGHPPRDQWAYEVEPVGATATLLVEKIQAQGLVLSAEEATLLLLGIYEDTGSLSYDTTTPRDVRAVAWLLEHQAQLHIARRFLNVALSDAQQALYDQLLHNTEWLRIEGRPIVLATAIAPPGFDDEISSVAHRLRETLTPDGLFVLVQVNDGVQLVARSSVDEVDAGLIAREMGGGGHSRAAAAMIVGSRLPDSLDKIREKIHAAIRPTLRVANIMSFGVETVTTATKVVEVAALMQKLGHEGYPVVDSRQQRVVGLVTRRAVDRAMASAAFAQDMGNQPVSRIMNAGTVTVLPSDTIERVQELMSTEGWGQIPVLPEPDSTPAENEEMPIGIVTRTDLMNALFKTMPDVPDADMRDELARFLSPELWAMVLVVSETAAQLRMPIYFVGGLVRDLLLEKIPTDLDIVVEGDAVHLVRSLSERFGGIIHSHDRFGTAKWFVSPQVYEEVIAHAGDSRPDLRELPVEKLRQSGNNAVQVPAPAEIDFVTARKEFYKRPTALPDVEPGSIKLDLHRRDFTINTLAIRIDGAYLGQLLDFYGGRRDLLRRLIRVLHSLSFIDDPTRILRAVRLEQRLGFAIEESTADLIADALPFLDRVTGDRIRHEIELALNEADPVRVMERLDELNVLTHLYPGLGWVPESADVFQRIPQFAADSMWREVYQTSPTVFFYFAAWLAPLPKPLPEMVARRLKARKSTLTDLLAVEELKVKLCRLPSSAKPSTIASICREHAPRTCLVVRMLNVSPEVNEWLDRFVSEWRLVKPAHSGDDLRQLGLPPGPVYTVILDRLLAARLDNEIEDEKAERAMLESILAELSLNDGTNSSEDSKMGEST
jgi:tRNA nucleotidyltransferase (CCA-adding enzyme)